MECEVCGRTKEEVEEEFGIEIEMQEHQGITKCSKCIQEYERELGDGEEAVSEEELDSGDWKDRIMA